MGGFDDSSALEICEVGGVALDPEQGPSSVLWRLIAPYDESSQKVAVRSVRFGSVGPPSQSPEIVVPVLRVEHRLQRAVAAYNPPPEHARRLQVYRRTTATARQLAAAGTAVPRDGPKRVRYDNAMASALACAARARSAVVDGALAQAKANPAAPFPGLRLGVADDGETCSLEEAARALYLPEGGEFDRLSPERQQILVRIADLRSSSAQSLATKVNIGSSEPQGEEFGRFSSQLAKRMGAKWLLVDYSVVIRMWRLQLLVDGKNTTAGVADVTNALIDALMQQELASLKRQGVDLGAMHYVPEIDDITLLPLFHALCQDHNLKNFLYALQKSLINDPTTLRATMRRSMMVILETLQLPMARALLHSAGDKQRSDAARYLLQSMLIIAALEAKAFDDARTAERTFSDAERTFPTFEAAVQFRARADPLYHTATMLRVFRGADTGALAHTHNDTSPKKTLEGWHTHTPTHPQTSSSKC